MQKEAVGLTFGCCLGWERCEVGATELYHSWFVVFSAVLLSRVPQLVGRY